MQVILLGAGASSSACHPLANSLLPAIEAMVGSWRNFVNLQTEWNVWENYRNRAMGPTKAFLSNPNPEIVFSFLDLCNAARDAESRARMASTKRGEKPSRRREHKQIADASSARASLLGGLQHHR